MLVEKGVSVGCLLPDYYKIQHSLWLHVSAPAESLLLPAQVLAYDHPVWGCQW